MTADRYLNVANNVSRLLEEYKKHGSLVIGVDFDNTIYDYHGVGECFPKMEHLLLQCLRLGFTICVYTGNDDREVIEKRMREIGIKNFHLNCSPIKSVSRVHKPFFNILLDDRAGLLSAFNDLTDVICIIDRDKEQIEYEKALKVIQDYEYKHGKKEA